MQQQNVIEVTIENERDDSVRKEDRKEDRTRSAGEMQKAKGGWIIVSEVNAEIRNQKSE